MTYDIKTFTSKLSLAVKSDKYYKGNRANELNAIASALTTDPTRRDATLQKAPVGLRPGRHTNTKFTNNVLLIVNRGKAGHLTPVAMSNAITAQLSKVLPPVNTAVPALTGTGTVGQTLSCTTGTWTYAPTSYGYSWRRNGVIIPGASTSTHVLVAADSGTSIVCVVTAHNAAGTTQAPPSNAIAVA